MSTMEVEGILQPIMNIQDATVFGVEIPGREGRAGMIGVELTEDTNIEVCTQLNLRRHSQGVVVISNRTRWEGGCFVISNSRGCLYMEMSYIIV